MSHGASAAVQTPSRERRKFVRRVIPIEERHIARAEPSAHGRQTPGRAAPVKAASRRSRARSSASLDGRRLVRQRRLPSVMRDMVAIGSPATPSCGSAPATHCADHCERHRKIYAACNVRTCQKKCDNASALSCATDRGAPCAFYPAIKRSVVCASPVLRYPSPNRHRTKTRTSRTRAGSARIWRS